ncbi:major capsid protein [Roseomonas sp. NAR14]|uniref:Major capsid protein n=1 Tax=Roseomonas acroporae TaxID=2937791 RepID=A0A9X1YAW7_9PROT|nr:major capsid protein [Roseomonas acroporae]
MLSSRGIAPAEGITTLDAAFEEATGSIRLLSSSPRGSTPSQLVRPQGAIRKLPSYHFSREFEVTADELLAALRPGTGQPETLESLINDRLEGPWGILTEWALTLEHLLLGAIDGVVYDADNATILYDFFGWTGTTRPAPVTIPFSTSTSDTAVIVQRALGLKRQVVRALNGLPTSKAMITVLCGDNFFDDFWTCREVVHARKFDALGSQDIAKAISESTPYSAFSYAGILWVNYRGTDDNATVAVPTDEARLFVEGVPGLFQTYYAPADSMEAVQAPGEQLYVLRRPERQTSKQVVLEVQSNPLIACIRPQSLRRLVRG